MSQYGIPSRKMLSFLNENPGSTAREISEHLFDGRTVEQVLVQYRYTSDWVTPGLRTQWQAKKYVLNHMMKSEWYQDIQILDERVQQLSKICRGKFAYLTSPYCSRTLSADFAGSKPHPGAANRNSQRCWFHRTKHNGVYIYWLTLIGMCALNKHGYNQKENHGKNNSNHA